MSETSGSALLAGNPAPAPAAADNSPAPAAAPAESAANGAWWDSIEDGDLKGYVQNKGWSNPVELATGYRNLEKLLGGEKIPMPKGAEDAEGWSRVYDALGRPKSAEDYKLSVPEGYGDQEFAKAAAGKFHELGLSAKQAQALTDWYNQTQGGALEQQTTQLAQRSEQELSTLRQEWGGAWDENVELGRRAAQEFGLDGDKLWAIEKALGTSELLKFMSRVGRGLTEHTFESGRSTTSFGMTPEAAKQRISALRGDTEFTAKYLSGNADAKAEMARLMSVAFPDQ